VCGSAAISTGAGIRGVYGKRPYNIVRGEGDMRVGDLRERTESAVRKDVPNAWTMLRERAWKHHCCGVMVWKVWPKRTPGGGGIYTNGWWHGGQREERKPQQHHGRHGRSGWQSCRPRPVLVAEQKWESLNRESNSVEVQQIPARSVQHL
jgi:hypothetical protein